MPARTGPPAEPDAGDSRALVEEAYVGYAEFCRRIARTVTRDAHLAEDVVQETFLSLWKSVDRIDRNHGGPAGWLAVVTHHRAVDLVRHETTRPRPVADTSSLLAEVGSDARGPESLAIASADAGTVRRALTTLSVAQRQVVVLAYYYGYSQREIALVVGVPIGTVKTRTMAALRKLRLALGPLEAG